MYSHKSYATEDPTDQREEETRGNIFWRPPVTQSNHSEWFSGASITLIVNFSFFYYYILQAYLLASPLSQSSNPWWLSGWYYAWCKPDQSNIYLFFFFFTFCWFGFEFRRIRSQHTPCTYKEAQPSIKVLFNRGRKIHSSINNSTCLVGTSSCCLFIYLFYFLCGEMKGLSCLPSQNLSLSFPK